MDPPEEFAEYENWTAFPTSATRRSSFVPATTENARRTPSASYFLATQGSLRPNTRSVEVRAERRGEPGACRRRDTPMRTRPGWTSSHTPATAAECKTEALRLRTSGGGYRFADRRHTKLQWAFDIDTYDAAAASSSALSRSAAMASSTRSRTITATAACQRWRQRSVPQVAGLPVRAIVPRLCPASERPADAR